MSNPSGIASFIVCRTCYQANRPHRLQIGLLDPHTLRIWCATCRRNVADYALADDQLLRCDVCGEPITEGHHH